MQQFEHWRRRPSGHAAAGRPDRGTETRRGTSSGFSVGSRLAFGGGKARGGRCLTERGGRDVRQYWRSNSSAGRGLYWGKRHLSAGSDPHEIPEPCWEDDQSWSGSDAPTDHVSLTE